MRVFFGGSGRLGKAFLGLHPEYAAPSSREVDVTDAEKVADFLRSAMPDVVIHAAAVVGLKEAERRPDHAYRVNVEGTRAVAAACRDIGARMIYTSSVSVFDGRRGMYTERCVPRPAYYYGWSKLLGEQAVLMHVDSVVVRTDFFVPGHFKYRDVYVDHYCSKLPVVTLSRALQAVASSDIRGILHIGGPRVSLYDLISGHESGVRGVRIADSSVPDFPRDLSLDSSLFRSLFPDILE
jgi:dTDP-4-dehydrorhamnose reductase